jgi:hypothetical protein
LHDKSATPNPAAAHNAAEATTLVVLIRVIARGSIPADGILDEACVHQTAFWEARPSHLICFEIGF